ncbi:MAG: hypothetical protein AAGB22_02145 [Bacteroidota bacterium]
MALLSDSQLLYIRSELETRGLLRGRMREEVLDHFCCLVEERMEAGVPFGQAFARTMRAFGPSSMRQLQQRTQRALFFRRWKQYTWQAGSVAAMFVLVWVATQQPVNEVPRVTDHPAPAHTEPAPATAAPIAPSAQAVEAIPDCATPKPAAPMVPHTESVETPHAETAAEPELAPDTPQASLIPAILDTTLPVAYGTDLELMHHTGYIDSMPESPAYIP